MFYLPIIVSLFSLAFAYFLIKEINRAPFGSGKMIEISQAIKEETEAFLKRQRRACFLTAVVIFLIFWLFWGFTLAAGFLVGAATSVLAGYLSMIVPIKANIKMAEAVKSGLAPAFNLTFRAGLAAGFLAVGLALLSVAGFYWLTQDLKALIALSFGALLIAIFTGLGKGIYTKAADVGDCAGIAGDMFQTYVITLSAAMFLGSLIFPNSPQAIYLPIYLALLGVLTSIIATFFVKYPSVSEGLRRRFIFFAYPSRSEGEKENSSSLIMSALYQGLMVAGVLSIIGFFPAISSFARNLEISTINLYLPVLVGLIMPVFIFIITKFFTSKKHSPVESIIQASQSGHSANLITGLIAGMKSTILPVFLISVGILISFWSGGIYGLAIAAVSMLSLTGLIIAINCYGSIADNASGISELAGLAQEYRKNTDALSAIGNAAKAITNGYAIVSASLAALVLFFAYTQEFINLGAKIQFFLEEPKVLVGLFIGGMAVYYFAVLAMTATGKTAGSMVLPALLPVILPVLIGFLLGPQTLGGLLIGSIIVGIFLAISMNYVIPGINPMIKTLNIVALLIVSFLV